ncbi:binding-protein-dependent transport systems inner membrane component [Gluconacetobacter diazotrophicus PA1 5]|uniref:ABC transporter permease n=2 Tax=Gluconacetobacter diazotrophicus TaxID=33996 RepID=A0A7W4I727_GLUDI|nr:methionine ABC transporter permease [Gluconacetobacter diazotrophicus]ACI50659.1 binding-protein-dependent transport systems inner membrane component [Gluconacetobacter diazotrophicus PA1 5]MBB2157473.1 ABC transporter permease [Gluconacetobacter diazotrophicus]TWB09491.1 D-methionine transport system permease protein [Gluconacetobacter diazotrophicus]CAP56599.1 putative D-methionine transport system permease protein metI [Gluconacetobacter diazotrophicus PA1 5]
MSRLIVDLVLRATVETLDMVLASGLIAVIGGLPLAVLLVATAPGGLYPLPALSRILGLGIDAVRAVPFMILLVLLIPLTRLVAGTTLGTGAAIVPLAIAAVPYFARIAEVSLREVDRGLVDAVRAMGGTRWMVVRYVLLPEALPGLISGFTVTLVTLVGASAMAGVIGAGGLGDLAIRYGYQRFNTQVMLSVVAVLIVMVTIIQLIGNLAARRLR